jgi:hypothetical protein
MSNRPIHVFIPAYNEEENIEEVIMGLKQLELDLELYVIDDGSTDGTAEKASKAGAAVIRHPVNLGGGAAVRTAFALALLSGADYIVTVDGDGQHDPKELLSIVEAVENGCDLVIGSRFLEKQDLKMPLYRRLGIKFFSWLMSKLVAVKITDATSCYRAYKTVMIKDVLPKLKENQYYGLEVLMRMRENKAKITEVPITSKPRKKGKSKKGILKYGYNLMRTVIKNLVKILI